MTDKTTDVYKDEAVIAEMIEAYTSAPDSDEARATVVSALAETLGKSVPSVRAVLVRQGVYKAKTRATKDGSVIVKKSELVDKISAAMAVALTESEAESLEKATKTTLKKILAAVEAVQAVEADPTDV